MKNIFLAVLLTVISVMSVKSQDSTDNPITNKIGLTCFPLEKKVGLIYCFGKNGRIKLEDNIKLNFPESSYLEQYTEINEFKFMYAWNCTGFKKVYSGVAMEYGTVYYNPGQRSYNSYGSIIPIGIECFPFYSLPNMSLIVEPNLTYIYSYLPGVRLVEQNIRYFGYVGLGIHFGLHYYF